ncbi:DNA ligase [Glaciimonas immobilis]|uniref:DNA ligase-1 n=1 Tax=Glaciimonas immobilis TaxID=728004 RepID=A0A840RUN3_9BURK|nr:DNA ligase [Glaciimonas immobilis]KAF3996747.1 DNA ligase [Glaciimonas immobilis]MBB5201333.1 DNA ligase-1 [Glaciimonas immobilis]
MSPGTTDLPFPVIRNFSLHYRKYLFALFVSTLLLQPLSLSATTTERPPPPLMQANVYHPGVNLNNYWVSEKFDGVRGYWDGEALWTRGGNPIYAPAWFTSGWPKVAMDGELWAGRGQFNQAVSTVRQKTPDDAAWRQIQFMVFDLPAYPGTFDTRILAMQNLVTTLAKPWVQPVAQVKVKDQKSLTAMLERNVRQDGEGLMLHRGDALYRGIRSDDLLKLKTHDDTEAKVVGYLPGKGKHQGVMGALVVETPKGLRFRIGTGFKDTDRQKPPVIGSWITYRYRGLNPSGVPRFASFMRVREEMSPPTGAP